MMSDGCPAILSLRQRVHPTAYHRLHLSSRLTLGADFLQAIAATCSSSELWPARTSASSTSRARSQATRSGSTTTVSTRPPTRWARRACSLPSPAPIPSLTCWTTPTSRRPSATPLQADTISGSPPMAGARGLSSTALSWAPPASGRCAGRARRRRRGRATPLRTATS